MERVSGWYTRQAQWIVVVIALIVVTLSGIDTFEMLWTLSILSPEQLSSIADAVQTDVRPTPGSTVPKADIRRAICWARWVSVSGKKTASISEVS